MHGYLSDFHRNDNKQRRVCGIVNDLAMLQVNEPRQYICLTDKGYGAVNGFWPMYHGNVLNNHQSDVNRRATTINLCWVGFRRYHPNMGFHRFLQTSEIAFKSDWKLFSCCNAYDKYQDLLVRQSDLWILWHSTPNSWTVYLNLIWFAKLHFKLFSLIQKFH